MIQPLKSVLRLATEKDIEQEAANKIKEKEEALSIADLAITGDDIKQLGVEEGPEIGKILNNCFDKVSSGEIHNKYKDLIKYIKSII